MKRLVPTMEFGIVIVAVIIGIIWLFTHTPIDPVMINDVDDGYVNHIGHHIGG